jgi:hypothetical protein
MKRYSATGLPLFVSVLLCSAILLTLAYVKAPASSQKLFSLPSIHFTLLETPHQTFEEKLAKELHNAIYSPLLLPFREMLYSSSSEELKEKIMAEPPLKQELFPFIYNKISFNPDTDIVGPVLTGLNQSKENSLSSLIYKRQNHDDSTFKEHSKKTLSLTLLPLEPNQNLIVRTLNNVILKKGNLKSPIVVFVEWDANGKITSVFLEENKEDKELNKTIEKCLYDSEIVFDNESKEKGRGYVRVSQ